MHVQEGVPHLSNEVLQRIYDVKGSFPTRVYPTGRREFVTVPRSVFELQRAPILENFRLGPLVSLQVHR